MINDFTVIAAPCKVETYEQLDGIVSRVVEYGANVLRCGAFKPGIKSKSFERLGIEDLKYYHEVAKTFGVRIISELLNLDHMDQFIEMVDIIQIGSQNMGNTSLLKEVAATGKTIMLERGSYATIGEYFNSLDYISNCGNDSIILCERGISGFEVYMGNTLDINAIPVLKQLTSHHLIADFRLGFGSRELVLPIAKAAISAGADGIMLEVYDTPESALCNGGQSHTLEEFRILIQELKSFICSKDEANRDNAAFCDNEQGFTESEFTLLMREFDSFLRARGKGRAAEYYN